MDFALFCFLRLDEKGGARVAQGFPVRGDEKKGKEIACHQSLLGFGSGIWIAASVLEARMEEYDGEKCNEQVCGGTTLIGLERSLPLGYRVNSD